MHKKNMIKVFTLALFSLLLLFICAGCSMHHFPTTIRGNIDADRYGVVLNMPIPYFSENMSNIPNKNSKSEKESNYFWDFLFNSVLQFEYTNRLSEKRAYSIGISPAAVIYFDYNYRIGGDAEQGVFIDPFISWNFFVHSIWGINSYVGTDRVLFGFKYVDAYISSMPGTSGDSKDTISRGIGPFLTLSDGIDTGKNRCELLYLYKFHPTFRKQYHNYYLGYNNIYHRK